MDSRKKGQFFIISVLFILVGIYHISGLLSNLRDSIIVNPTNNLVIIYLYNYYLRNDIDHILNNTHTNINETILDLKNLAKMYEESISNEGMKTYINIYINESTTPKTLVMYEEITSEDLYLHKREILANIT